MPAININLPNISDESLSEEKERQQIRDYLFNLTEQLRFTLSTLDEDNMSSAFINRLYSYAEGNLAELNVTADGILSRVASAEGNISTVEQTANGIEATVSGLKSAQDATKLLFNSSGLNIYNGGLRIYNGSNKQVVYFDTSGNLNIEGKITAESGKIGGFTIGRDSLSGTNISIQSANGTIESEYSGNKLTLFRSSLFFYENNQQTAQIDVGKYGVRVFTMGGSVDDEKGDVALLSSTGTLYIGNYGSAALQNRIVVANPATASGTANVRWVQRTSAPHNGEYSLGWLTSSIRYKRNVKDVGDCTALIDALRPITYEPKDTDEGGIFYGFIAEEVAETSELLTDYEYKDGKKIPHSVQYDRIPVILVKDAQKTHERLRAIEERLGMIC